MTRFKPIPNWVYTGKLPAFYDTESGTAVEQTARLHGVVKGLVDDYNKFVNELNTYINEFISSTNQDADEFKEHIDKIMHDYIAMIDDKIKMQDADINEAISFMKDNLGTSISTLIAEMKESGELSQVVVDGLDDLSTQISEINTQQATMQNNINALNENIDDLSNEVDAMYIDNVSKMKSLLTISEGFIIKTLGYHSVNDGGGALYRVRTKTIEDIEDGGFIHFLQNELVAELIIENNTINIKQLGAVSFNGTTKDDIAKYLEVYTNFIENNENIIKLYIPSGIWYCSGYNFAETSGFNIFGDISFNIYKGVGTIITSLNDNQDYILSVGNSNTNVLNWNIKDIIFTSDEFTYNSDIKKYTFSQNPKPIKCCLKLLQATFGTTDNLFFLHIKGEALNISSCWENYFKLLNFRHVYNPSGSVMNFSTRDKTINQNTNITANCFDKIMFEAVIGNLINFEQDCSLSNCHFGLINFEDYAIKNFTNYTNSVFTTDTATEFDSDPNAKHYSMFKFQPKSYGQIDVGSIELNNVSYYKHNYDGLICTYDRIVDVEGQDTFMQVAIDTLTCSGMEKDLALLKNDGARHSLLSEFKINKILNKSLKKMFFDVLNFPYIECQSKLTGSIVDENIHLGNQFTPFYESITNEVVNAKNGQLCYEPNSKNKLKLCINPKLYVQNAEFLITGTKFVIYAKIPADITITMSLYHTDGGTYIPLELVGTGDYKFYEFTINQDRVGKKAGLRLTTGEYLADVIYLDSYKFV